MILPFDSEQATLENAGGKGANLARLYHMGFPVPPGFILDTSAYQEFVGANQLEATIQSALAGLSTSSPEELEHASTLIRAAFTDGEIPASIGDAIQQAYAHLGSGPVAVRSSATTEDLPEMSFAGQQDTFLNVIGDQSLLKAIVDCWSSLWTARAIGYRARNGLAQVPVSLAVVVQEMIPSQASGVLFTANPLTGLRTETIIDATLGLGEALVSGQVEPDQYVVNLQQGKIIQKTLGAKALAILPQEQGGVIRVEQEKSLSQALPDEQIMELAELCQRVAADYGTPQDIEWAWSVGKLYLLQARPVTSLFPLPEKKPNEPLKVMFSFAAVQGMLDPVTPFGSDLLRQVFSVGSRLFGIRKTLEAQTILWTAGERLWVNFTPLLRNTVGRKIIRPVLSMVEPTVLQAVNTIWDEPDLQPGSSGIRLKALTQIARFVFPMGVNLIRNLASPDKRREQILRQGETVLAVFRERYGSLQGDPRSQLLQAIENFNEIYNQYLPKTLIMFVSGVASGVASFNWLRVLSKDLPAKSGQPTSYWSDLLLKVTRGIPHNPTTEMDLALWRASRMIRSDPASRNAFVDCPAPELAQQFQSGDLPQPVMHEIGVFLDLYGGRGLAEIDAGRPRWLEDPTPVFEALSGYMQIEDSEQTPDALFVQGSATADQAIERLAAAVRQTPRGWLKARIFRFAAHRVRALMGMRESPKFFAVRFFSIVRWSILRIGSELAATGDLEHPDDLFYLGIPELKAFAAGEPRDWRAIIAGHRTNYQRELKRRQVPRLLLSDGRAFYEGLGGSDSSGNAIAGSPVSPGLAEGTVRVVFDPRQTRLLPGEILVCPGTDPTWTPLFLTAAGLVMEVGGMMTHGAVVAREYGIPAVVGVHQATTRLQTGQRIRVDGTSGRIVLLDESD